METLELVLLARENTLAFSFERCDCLSRQHLDSIGQMIGPMLGTEVAATNIRPNNFKIDCVMLRVSFVVDLLPAHICH